MKMSSKIKLNIFNKSALIVIALIISSCSNSLTTKETTITDEINQQKEVIKLFSQKLLKDPKNEKLIFDSGDPTCYDLIDGLMVCEVTPLKYLLTDYGLLKKLN